MESVTDEKRVGQKLPICKSLPTYHICRNSDRRASDDRLARMSSRHFFLAVLTFSLLVIGLVFATMKGDKIFPSATLAISETQRQVQGVFNDKYHAALLSHSANTIPPNVNRESKIALETARQPEGDTAQNIAELGKRQNNSGNETSSTQTTSPTETSSSTVLSTTSTTTESSTTSTQSTTSSSVTGISSTSTTSETTISQSSVTVSSAPSTGSSSMTTDSKSSNTTPSSTMKGTRLQLCWIDFSLFRHAQASCLSLTL